MLTKEEVEDLLANLAKLKSSTVNNSKEPSEDARRQSLIKKAPGDLLYFINPLPDVIDDKTNDSKPFYKVISRYYPLK